MDMMKNMFKISLKNFNIYTVLSILFLLAGIFIYLYWKIRYEDVWYDIGIYSLMIVLIIPGIIGIFLSLMEKEEED